MKILLIEDEKSLSKLIKEALEKNLFTVETALNGEDGSYLALNQEFDLIILDILLPGKNGWTILKEIRMNKISTPVLMLTALSEIESRVEGLNKGADDYLPKPFDLRELIARIQALLRRSKNDDSRTEILRCEDLELNMTIRTVTRQGKKIELTKKEYQLLEYLLLNKGKVVSKREIEEHIWNDEEELWSDPVRSHIKNLRKKIDSSFRKKIIHTQRGIGYVLDGE